MRDNIFAHRRKHSHLIIRANSSALCSCFECVQVCLLAEMKPLVFCWEVLGEVLMLAAVQEHVESSAFVLHQVGTRMPPDLCFQCVFGNIHTLLCDVVEMHTSY